MSITHFKNNTIGDFTGTVTVFNSLGNTVTANATDLVRPSDWNSNHNIVFNLSGNTAGSSQLSGADIIFVGGNNITLSADTANSKMVISAPNTAAQSQQPMYYSAANGNTSSGTIQFANSNGVSFSTGTQGVYATVATNYQSQGAYLTTARASNDAIGLNSALTANGVSVTANSSGLSLNFPAFLTTADLSQNSSNYQATSAMSRYLVMTNSSQTYAGTNVTMTVYSTNISISAAAGGGGGIANAAGTQTATSGTVVFSNSNGITFGMSNSSVVTASYNSTQFAGVGSAITNGAMTFNTAGLSLNLTQLAGTSTGFTGANISGSMTHNSAGLALSMSVAAPGGGGAINISAGTTSNNLQTIVFSNSNGVSFGLNGSTVTASAVGGGGAGYTNTWFQPELYGATLTTSHANGTVFMRAFELQGNMDIDKYIMQQYMSTQQSSTLSFSASVSAGNASSGTGSWGQSGTVLLFSRVNTNETNASYNSIVTFASDSYYLSAGYSASVSWSTNVSSATASWTTSGAVAFPSQIDAAGGVTYGTTATSGSSTFSSTSTNANSFSSSYILSFPYAHLSGMRPLYIPAGVDAVPGEYWMGIIQSTATGSTNMSLQRPLLFNSTGMLYFTASSNNSFIEYGNSANISSSNWRLGFGSYSASSNTTAAFPLSAITSMSSNASMYVALDGHTK